MTMRTPLWVRAFLVLMAISLALSIIMLSAVEMNITTVIIVSAITLMILGATFLVAFWLATWMNKPDYGTSRGLHDRKMARHEINRLQHELAERDRYIMDLEATLRYLRSESICTNVPPPPIRATQEMPAVRPQTQPGTYYAPPTGLPPHPQTAYVPAVDVRPSGTHPAVNRTGSYPPIETGTQPAIPASPPPPTLPGQTGQYHAVRNATYAGRQLRVARQGSQRNSNYTSV